MLVTEYPSGMDVNALLAAKNLGINAENVVVSNGLEEIIQCIVRMIAGSVGCVLPTNEELVNRCGRDRLEGLIPSNKDLSYTAKDVIEYFEPKDIAAFVLVNPEYHTGNYIHKKDVLHILDWSVSKGISIIVDESYCDFADEQNNSLINHDVLERYPNLIILKNISVTHGISGLRLGCAISGNAEWIRSIRRDLSIWNINSLAEFYLQIEEKYQKDYQSSLDHFKSIKQEFYEELLQLPGIRPIPSQANYYLCELGNGMTSGRLCELLLTQHNILLKDMSDRVRNGRQYIKVAVRNEQDNHKLIMAMNSSLSN